MRHLSKGTQFGSHFSMWCGNNEPTRDYTDKPSEADCPACLATAWVERASEARALEKRLTDLAGGRR